MKNFVQKGDTITVPAPNAVSSGGGALVGSLFGVAVHSAAQGEDVSLNLTGVYDLPKTSAQAWAVGAPIYWDDTDKVATTDAAAGANTLIGAAFAVAANPSATGSVRLNGAVVG